MSLGRLWPGTGSWACDGAILRGGNHQKWGVVPQTSTLAIGESDRPDHGQNPEPGPRFNGCKRLPEGLTGARKWVLWTLPMGKDTSKVRGYGLSRSQSFGSFASVKCLLVVACS